MTEKEKTRARGAQVQMRRDDMRREYPRPGDSKPEIWLPKRRRGNHRNAVRNETHPVTRRREASSALNPLTTLRPAVSFP